MHGKHIFVIIMCVPFFCSFYLQEGFVHIQNIVGEAIIRLIANPYMTDCNGTLKENITVSMKQLPYPDYNLDFFLITASSVLPFLIIVAFIYSAGIFTKVYLYPHTKNTLFSLCSKILTLSELERENIFVLKYNLYLNSS